MTVQFVDGHFVDSYYPTIENTFSKMIKWKNQDFATEIIDTAGQVREELLCPRSRKSSTPHLSSEQRATATVAAARDLWFGGMD